MAFQSESDPVAPSPDYCQRCGNIDFWAARSGWWCHYCHPLPQRELQYDRGSKKAPKPVGEPTPEIPTSPFWTPRQVLERWDIDFIPPEPTGPALGALALRRAKERKNTR